jgi:hypothetical protein
VDKFSKWIEAVPVTNQEATTAVKFFESIVYRYGVPNSIITDIERGLKGIIEYI